MTSTDENRVDYSQCQPGVAVITTTAASTTIVTTTAAAPTRTGFTPTTGTGSGYYWIRAVEPPNFHKYLQSNPLYSTRPAVMGGYTTASQFQVVDGQLVLLISAPGATAQLLCGVVSARSGNENNI
ncbi:uncharacterized protein K441DRAFT_306139 [Cenococcum geophilum 1.58]|uniref:uncharacterized protein n=1 Tax=Cenococcum geophilum 1.58 TaxID=794803 RepID=UPI00358EF5E2|nr:hypothetical protein K441DRAFT_306139 [Cenococcum geophilum 1.58]